MSRFLAKLQVLILRNYWTRVSYRLGLSLGIVSGFVGLLQFALLGTFLQAGNTFPEIEQYGGHILAYLVVGNVFGSFVAVTLRGFSSFLRNEQRMGTLEALCVTCTPLAELLVSTWFTGLVSSAVNAGLIFMMVVWLFDVPLSVNFLGVVVVLLGLIFSVTGFGLASAGVLLVSKEGEPLTWLLMTLTGLISGVLYPVSILPGWVQQLSWALPTTQALHGLRLACSRGAGPASLQDCMSVLALWGSVTLPAGFLVLRWGLAKARRQGSLGEF